MLTTLTVGGREELQLLNYLPPARRQAIAEKGQALLNIEREKRVSFMVSQLREALHQKNSRGIERIDPSWLAFELKTESPRVVGSVLIGLPGKTIKSVVRRLPPTIRDSLPPKRQMSAISPDILNTIQLIFESRFYQMPQLQPLKEFSFPDLLRFDRNELSILMRSAGLAELGQAFVSVGKMALIDFCRQLPKEQSEELIIAVKRATRGDPMELKTAQRFLSRVATDFTSHDDFFHKAGLWRMAKSSLIESNAFAMAFSQRLPREPGLLFRRMLETSRTMEDISVELTKGFQDGLLAEIPSLLAKGKLDAKWAEHPIRFHDPERFVSHEETPAGDPGSHADIPGENQT